MDIHGSTVFYPGGICINLAKSGQENISLEYLQKRGKTKSEILMQHGKKLLERADKNNYERSVQQELSILLKLNTAERLNFPN